MKAALAGAGVEYRDRIVGQRRELTIRLAVVQVAGSKGRKTVRHASRVGSQNSSLGSHGEERDEEGQGGICAGREGAHWVTGPEKEKRE